MALIKCPECGGEVSDQAEICIHCGFPLKQTAEEKLYDVVFTGFTDKKAAKNSEKIADQLHFIVGLKPKKIMSNFKSDHYVIIQGLTKQKADWVRQLLLPYGCQIETPESEKGNANNDSMLDKYDTSSAPGIICPKCGAMSITTGRRGYSIMTGLIGAGKTVNRCSQCGYKWEL